MWTTLDLLTAAASPALLEAILNGVAMMCNQTGYILSFALLASTWRLFSASASATLHTADGSASGVLARGAMTSFMPFFLALCLTAPGMKTKVNIESLKTGAVSVVDNVPVVIAIIPSAVSVVVNDISDRVRTAFQGVSADYSTITSKQSGFLNPLKVVLSARTAIARLGGIDAEVRAVAADCLAPSVAATSTSDITALVRNAGNSGATAAQTIPINGVQGTALGALLYQVSLGTGYATSISTAPGTMLSCADAALQVADDVGNAITSVEYERIVQGSINGMDDPGVGGDYSFATSSASYKALRTQALTAGLAGQVQAEAEWLNLLTAELVENNLQCLNAQNNAKVVCETTMMQSTEMERTNLANAAAAVPVLKYAGAFGDYMIALVIGLGPVIVMFMMLSGFGAGKAIMTMVHICAWPLLVTNLGAELVNGMIVQHVSGVLRSLTEVQGAMGNVTHALASQAYKEISLQVGVGSSLMASLSAVMSMIFAFAEYNTLHGAESGGKPAGDDIQRVAAPQVATPTPMVSTHSGAEAQRVGGGYVVTPTGATKSVSANSSLGQVAKDQYLSSTEAIGLSKTTQEAHDMLNSVRNGSSYALVRSLGFDDTKAREISKALTTALDAGHSQHTGQGSSKARDNSERTTSTVSGEAHAGGGVRAGGGGGGGGGGEGGEGRGKPGFSLGGMFDAGASARAGTQRAVSAANTERSDSSAGDRNDVRDMKTIQDVLRQAHHDSVSNRHGNNNETAWSRALEATSKYSEALQKTEDTRTTSGNDIKKMSNFVMSSNAFGSEAVAAFSNSNAEFAQHMTNAGVGLANAEGFSRHMHEAEKRAAEGTADRYAGSDPRVGHNIAMLGAAVRASQDESLPEATRLQALQFATGALAIMNGVHLPDASGAGKPLGVALNEPGNTTGTTQKDLEGRADAHGVKPLTQHGAGLAKSGKAKGVRAKASTSELDSVEARLKTGQADLAKVKDDMSTKVSKKVTSAEEATHGTTNSRAPVEAVLAQQNQFRQAPSK